MRIIYLVLILLLTSCAGSVQIPQGQKYVSPFGGFSCGPFPFGTEAQASFGPHGGTVRFINEYDFTRVDIEEFEPKLNSDALDQYRSFVYSGYLTDKMLPLIKLSVPDARILDAQSSVIDGYAVHQSAILMPGTSSVVLGSGKRLDGIRGQVQYTNGQHMYVVSNISDAEPGMTVEKQVGLALASSGNVFRKCEFPK